MEIKIEHDGQETRVTVPEAPAHGDGFTYTMMRGPRLSFYFDGTEWVGEED